MSAPNNGELSFSLTEKEDRNGETYLFAGVQLLGAVIFIRPDGTDGRGKARWKLTLKKYTGPADPDAAAWEDDKSSDNKQTLGRQR